MLSSVESYPKHIDGGPEISALQPIQTKAPLLQKPPSAPRSGHILSPTFKHSKPFFATLQPNFVPRALMLQRSGGISTFSTDFIHRFGAPDTPAYSKPCFNASSLFLLRSRTPWTPVQTSVRPSYRQYSEYSDTLYSLWKI